jgi:glycosyltransferase involved in cell wall biosynthesis
MLRQIGWDDDKIIPCGYFPPPLLNSSFTSRTKSNLNDFHILCTGIPSWHRGTDLLPKAMKLLKNWGIPCRATITQNGPLVEKMRNYSSRHSLNIDFTGFVSIENLLNLYENCSCYVALGRQEPWGIRVNDALHCGAPLLISRGMGADKLINDYNCGLCFHSNDHVDLANQLRRLMEDSNYYLSINDSLREASFQSLPENAAKRIGTIIKERFPNWINCNL